MTLGRERECAVITVYSIILIALGFLVLPAPSCAETPEESAKKTSYTLRHIQPGILIEHNDQIYMAYTLEEFKRIAILDAEHHKLLGDYRLALREIEILEARDASWQRSMDKIETRLKRIEEMEGSSPQPEMGWKEWAEWGFRVAILGGLLVVISRP